MNKRIITCLICLTVLFALAAGPAKAEDLSESPDAVPAPAGEAAETPVTAPADETPSPLTEEADETALPPATLSPDARLTGTVLETAVTPIPHDIRYVLSDDLFIGEEHVVRPGHDGEMETVWQITLEDGLVTARVLISQRVVTEPEEGLILCGNKAQPVHYVLSDNMRVYASVGSYSVRLGGTILASGSAEGTPPASGYTTVLTVLDPYGNVAAQTTEPFPASLSVTGLFPGQYRVTASLSANDETITSGAVVTVTDKEASEIRMETVTVKFTVPYTVEYIKNGMTAGTVIRPGINGEKVMIYSVTYTDGAETARTLISEKTAADMIPELIAAE